MLLRHKLTLKIDNERRRTEHLSCLCSMNCVQRNHVSPVDEGKFFCKKTANKCRRNYRIRKSTILSPLKSNNFRQWSTMDHKTVR